IPLLSGLGDARVGGTVVILLRNCRARVEGRRAGGGGCAVRAAYGEGRRRYTSAVCGREGVTRERRPSAREVDVVPLAVVSGWQDGQLPEPGTSALGCSISFRRMDGYSAMIRCSSGTMMSRAELAGMATLT